MPEEDPEFLARRNALVLQHASLAADVAWGICRKLPRSVEIEDLLQTGLVGLIQAANEYDPARGASFTTFARYRVRGAILTAVHQAYIEGIHAALTEDVAGMLLHPSPSAEQVLLDAEDSGRLEDALRRAPKRDRKVMQMRFRGQKVEEIRQQLGLSPAQVRKVERQALARLKRLAA